MLAGKTKCPVRRNACAFSDMYAIVKEGEDPLITGMIVQVKETGQHGVLQHIIVNDYSPHNVICYVKVDQDTVIFEKCELDMVPHR